MLKKEANVGESAFPKSTKVFFRVCRPFFAKELRHLPSPQNLLIAGHVTISVSPYVSSWCAWPAIHGDEKSIGVPLNYSNKHILILIENAAVDFRISNLDEV